MYSVMSVYNVKRKKSKLKSKINAENTFALDSVFTGDILNSVKLTEK